MLNLCVEEDGIATDNGPSALEEWDFVKVGVGTLGLTRALALW